ncbi:MAG: hypothetical protein KJ043_07885, partial [Anaerolineae bacterium]|nr:hypothetical protein [Anaerolineae bacterium]
RGVVAILDARVLTKRYGVSFLEAVPDCTMRDGALDNLPIVAQEWLNR